MKNLKYFGVFFVVAILALYWKNKPGFGITRVNDRDIKQALGTTAPDQESTVSLLTVLRNSLNRQSNENPRTVRAEAIYAGGKADNQALAQRQFTRAELERAEKYFNKLISYKKPKGLYDMGLRIFGDSDAGVGAARWVTLGLVFDSSVTYGDALAMGMKDANLQPSDIYQALKKSIDEIRMDPFFYQMAMNLVHQMDLNESAKAEFFGREAEHQLKSLTAQKPTDAFWISVMGLKLAQQSGLRAIDLQNYLERGMDESKGSKQVLSEVRELASLYFPGMNL